MQQLVVDVTGKSFPEYMREAVLGPVGMTRSTYRQPLPPERAAETASGYFADGSAVPGKWHVYPEMAAAGLWTTPTDLARFAIEVQQSLAGKSNKVLSQAMTRQQLTVQKGDYGLGFALSGSGAGRTFGHNGRDEGFDALHAGVCRDRSGHRGDDQRERQLRRQEPYRRVRQPQVPLALSLLVCAQQTVGGHETDRRSRVGTRVDYTARTEGPED